MALEWFEKEDEYEKRWASGRVPDRWKLWNYIPKSKHAFIDDVHADSDGYWIWLDEDHVAYDGGEDCRIIHEYTLADLREAAKTIRRR